MSDDSEEDPVDLGDGPAVEGAPLARVSSRLTWPIQASEVDRLEGQTPVRTPDGPVELGDLLAEVEVTYFERRQAFESAVRDAIGPGPVRTAE